MYRVTTSGALGPLERQPLDQMWWILLLVITLYPPLFTMCFLIRNRRPASLRPIVNKALVFSCGKTGLGEEIAVLAEFDQNLNVQVSLLRPLHEPSSHTHSLPEVLWFFLVQAVFDV